MGKTIGIIAIKGGVGKTTISASLASDLANRYGKKVLLIDANYSAPNLGLHMDIVEPNKTIHHVLDRKSNMSSAIHNRFGVHVVPGDYVYRNKLNLLKLKDKIKSVSKKYDFVVIDSSPSLNDELLSTMLASDSLFVVTTPDYPTLSCTLKAAMMAKQRGRPIDGLIINKVRDPKYELNLREIEDSVGIPVVARIPDDKTAVRAVFSRIPISVYNSNAKFSKEISRLNAALTQTTERKSIWHKLIPTSRPREQINREFLKNGFYESSFGK